MCNYAKKIKCIKMVHLFTISEQMYHLDEALF